MPRERTAARPADPASAAGPECEEAPGVLHPERVNAIWNAARAAGILADRSSRIGGRISPVLVALAKQRTGIASNSELIAFALASLALDDDFVAVMKRLEATVDPDIPLGY